MVIEVLGPVTVRCADALDGTVDSTADGTVDIGSPRHREVLAALVVDVGRVVPAESLLERVWGDGARGATPANLYAVVSRLRSRLRERVPEVTISTVAPGYRLDTPAGAVDARRFEDGVARARDRLEAGDLEAAHRQVTAALALWRGEAYADIPQPFAEAEAARLEGRRLAALELEAGLDLALGRHAAVAERLPALVAAHPLRETFHAQLVLALYRCGRQGEALGAYARAREVLADELGVDPGPDLQRLHHQVLTQDPGLDHPDRAATTAGAPGPRPQPGATPASVAWPGASPSDLVGRHREVEYVVSLLLESSRRLLTLTGVGGVGKTRLAQAVARAAAPDFPDGVVVVPLAALTEAAAVLPAVARSCGLPTVDGEDPTAALTEHLRPLHTLVVLDNAEHLLDVGPSVSALVAACPGLTVLVTSRVPLRVRGESQFQVQPLGLPAAGAADPAEVGRSDAVRLFLDRADAVRPGYVLDAANAADVGALCRRLGGIPLALELVAARSRLCAPAVLLTRLDEVMTAAGARDLPPRQRTMRATIDWSHDLLEPEEQRLLRRLSVFSGGFTLEAAQEVWAAGREDAPPLLPVLEALVDHSLVLTDLDTPGTRFRMLEPIVQYAASRLGGDEERVARLAHLHHFLALAERTEPDYRSSATVEALALTETEHGNLVGALEWATTHGHADLAGRIGWAIWLYWWLRGRPGEGRHLMEGVLAQDLPDDVRVRAFAVLGAMAFAQGDLEGARCWTEGRALAAATGDTAGEAHCVAGEGLIALAQGDLETADRTLQEAVPLCDDEAVGRWLWTLTHVWRATVVLLQGAPEQALPLLDVALRSARARQDRLAVYITLFTAAQVSTAAGEHGRARTQLEEGVRLSLDTGDMANLAYFLEALAVVEHEEARHDRVGVLHGAAQRLRETASANVYGYYQPDQDRLAQVLADSAGARGDDWAADLARGRRLSLRQVVDFATPGA